MEPVEIAAATGFIVMFLLGVGCCIDAYRKKPVIKESRSDGDLSALV